MTENQVVANESAESAQVENEETVKNASVRKLRVYERESDYKNDDGTPKKWYSATLSNGHSCNVVFKCTIPPDMGKAFEISNVWGNMKSKEVIKKSETYTNYTYYVTQCDFSEIPAEILPL